MRAFSPVLPPAKRQTYSPVTAIAGIAFWLDAASIVGSDGDRIATDTDQGGEGNDFTSSGIARPTYRPTGLNGYPALEFDGVANEQINDDIAALLVNDQAYTFAIVVEHDALGVDGEYYFTTADPGGNLPTHDFYFRAASQTYWTDRREDSAAEKSFGCGSPDTSPHVLVYVFNGTVGTIYVDGVSVGSFTQDSGAAFTPTLFTICSHRRDTITDGFVNGMVGDRLLWTAAASTAQVTDLTRYLASKFGLTLTDPVYTPMSESTVLGVYDSIGINGLGSNTEGNTFATWYNRSTISSDVTGTGSVTYKVCWHNGRDAFRVGGNRLNLPSALVTPLSGTNVAFTVAGTFRLYDLSIQHTLWSVSDGTAGGSYHRIYTDTSGVIKVAQKNDAGTTTTITGSTLDAGPHRYEYVCAGATSTLYIDGVAVFTAQALSGGACTVSVGAIGAFMRDAASENWYDEMSAFCCFSSALASVADLDEYLSNIWGSQPATSLVCDIQADALVYSDANCTTAVTADGDNVLSVLSSVCGSQFRNSSSTYKAVFKTNQIATTKPCLRFANTALISKTLGHVFSGTKAFTITLVIKTATAETGIALGYATEADNSDYGYLRARNSGNTPTGITFQRSNGSAVDGTTDPGNGWAVVTIRSNGTYVKVAVNGGTEVSGNPTGTPASTLDIVSLGSLVRSSALNGQLYAACDLAAFRIRNYDDSSFIDRDALNAKYLVY